MRTAIVNIVLSLCLLLLHTSVIKFLAIGTIAPDIILLWVVYLSLRQGQMIGTTAGFFLGLALDLLSGSDGMLGLAALSKTAAGFIAGYFFSENKIFQILGSYQFIVVVIIASFVHNGIYFVIYLQGTQLTWSEALLSYGIPATAYTAAVGLIPMFAFARKYLT